VRARGVVLLSVIIPAYNEEARIEQTLIDYSAGLAKRGAYEIIVV
jgi:glycosyltransferase involved in cell wall biosynthesis